jgi:hypothetical protein
MILVWRCDSRCSKNGRLDQSAYWTSLSIAVEKNDCEFHSEDVIDFSELSSHVLFTQHPQDFETTVYLHSKQCFFGNHQSCLLCPIINTLWKWNLAFVKGLLITIMKSNQTNSVKNTIPVKQNSKVIFTRVCQQATFSRIHRITFPALSEIH